MKKSLYGTLACGAALLAFGCASAPETPAEVPATPADMVPVTTVSQPASSKASISQGQYFGQTRNKETVTLYTLKGAGGVVMDIVNYGCKVVRLYLPDKNGELVDCTTGYNTVDGYENGDHYFGSVIGRYGNRIAKGEFILDGLSYRLPTNNEPGGLPCCLHGGLRGWEDKVWNAAPFQNGDDVGIVFTAQSEDGDQGFPGNVQMELKYTLTADNVWRLEYKAVTDKATPINMTNHIYFNFHGEAEGTILDHTLTLFADKITPVDAGLIPTGEFMPVAGTPFDFTTPHKIGERVDADDEQIKFGGGYDHNYVLTSPAANGELAQAAELYDEQSGRFLQVWTSEPGVQFYCGNFLEPSMTGKKGKPYAKRSGLALETQHYPDSPNQPNFPSTILRPGETYTSTTEYRFGVK